MKLIDFEFRCGGVLTQEEKKKEGRVDYTEVVKFS